jgi:hypothetical protein
LFEQNENKRLTSDESVKIKKCSSCNRLEFGNKMCDESFLCSLRRSGLSFTSGPYEEATTASGNDHVDEGHGMILQNLVEARQVRDAIIKKICDGVPSHCTEEQALRDCRDTDLLTQLAIINDRIGIVEGELVRCGRAYRLRLGDIVLRTPMQSWVLLVRVFVNSCAWISTQKRR